MKLRKTILVASINVFIALSATKPFMVADAIGVAQHVAICCPVTSCFDLHMHNCDFIANLPLYS